MPGRVFDSSKIYLSIIEGSFRQNIGKEAYDRIQVKNNGQKNAIIREYETSDKKTGTKYELSFMDWTGRIQDIRVKDTQFGEIMEIDMGDAVINIVVKARYFGDFMAKLPNIKINEEVTLHPYDFEVDGKRKTGISIVQEKLSEDKVLSYYWNDTDKKACNGIPMPPKKNMSKDDWVVFFIAQANFYKETLPGIIASIEKANSMEENGEFDLAQAVENMPPEEMDPNVALQAEEAANEEAAKKPDNSDIKKEEMDIPILTEKEARKLDKADDVKTADIPFD